MSWATKQLEVSRSGYYYKIRSGRRGLKPSTCTLRTDGTKADEEEIKREVEELLSQEFVDYGYVKVSRHLQQKGYRINKKKVYRLMKKWGWLNRRKQRGGPPKTVVLRRKVRSQEPFKHLQVDLKYIYIHGQRRNALLITIIDVCTRLAMSWHLGYSGTHVQVIETFDQALSKYQKPENVILRSDNGSQFEAIKFREYLVSKEMKHEYTHKATPQENAFIESFHSIVESAVCRRHEFETLEDAQSTFERFYEFYNNERLHSSLGYMSPVQYLKKIEQDKQRLQTVAFSA